MIPAPTNRTQPARYRRYGPDVVLVHVCREDTLLAFDLLSGEPTRRILIRELHTAFPRESGLRVWPRTDTWSLPSREAPAFRAWLGATFEPGAIDWDRPWAPLQQQMP